MVSDKAESCPNCGCLICRHDEDYNTTTLQFTKETGAKRHNVVIPAIIGIAVYIVVKYIK